MFQMGLPLEDSAPPEALLPFTKVEGGMYYTFQIAYRRTAYGSFAQIHPFSQKRTIFNGPNYLPLLMIKPVLENRLVLAIN